MCNSKAEGGKRCFYHLNKSYKAAAAQVDALTEDASDSQVEKVQARYEDTVAALASEPTGLLHLRKRADAIEAGDTLAGDNLAVLRRYAPPKEPSATTVSVTEALATGKPVSGDTTSVREPLLVPRTEGVFAANLAEALAHGKPMQPERRTTKTVAPSRAWDDTSFAAALRGERTPFREATTGGFPNGIDENGPSLLT